MAGVLKLSASYGLFPAIRLKGCDYARALHYEYAIVMLVGLLVLRPGFPSGGRDRQWWTVALSIQFFHHIEHLLLLIQAQGPQSRRPPVPTSLVQFFVPRVELHLFYNTIVFIPMVVAMYYHLFLSPREASAQNCTCSRHSHAVAVA